jgi:hypothetical protein
MRIVIFAVLSALTWPATAQTADGTGPSPREAIYGVVGIGTPVGFLGGEFTARIERDLEISVGAGFGLSTEKNAANYNQLHVLQWAVMPRYRVGDGRNVLTLGAGLSGGNYSHTAASLCASQEDESLCNDPASWRYTLWTNVEVGGEYWAASHFAFRYFVGYGHIVAQGAQHCTFQVSVSSCDDDPAGSFPYSNIPYFGLAFGGWL